MWLPGERLILDPRDLFYSQYHISKNRTTSPNVSPRWTDRTPLQKAQKVSSPQSQTHHHRSIQHPRDPLQPFRMSTSPRRKRTYPISRPRASSSNKISQLKQQSEPNVEYGSLVVQLKSSVEELEKKFNADIKAANSEVEAFKRGCGCLWNNLN